MDRNCSNEHQTAGTLAVEPSPGPWIYMDEKNMGGVRSRMIPLELRRRPRKPDPMYSNLFYVVFAALYRIAPPLHRVRLFNRIMWALCFPDPYR
jgi:hypothetical protein